MIIYLTVLLGVALVAVIIALISVRARLAERNNILDRAEAELRSREESYREEKRQIEQASEQRRVELNNELQTEKAERARLEERLRYIESEKERLSQESEQRFRLLAGDILEANTKRFKEQSEQRLGDLLSPFREELERFKKTVTDVYSQEARERFALGERIKELVMLNETIGREAKELTHALRGDSKVQGDWGEMILETLLEKSGLKKGVHFELQVTTDADGNVLRDANGRQLRPDAVIYYPDNRCVVVDSKVSLTNYIDFINSDPDSDRHREAAMGHLRSVKAHVKELATKKYQDIVGEKRADFVTMFIPNEGAYMAALNQEPQLWQEAYDQRVLIVSPTHLLSFLRLAEQMWRQDDMKKNVMEISVESGKMYDKFVGFLDDMAKIEKGLTSVSDAYRDAMNKLSSGRGNLVGRAEKLRIMGAKTTKNINSNLFNNALPDGE